MRPRRLLRAAGVLALSLALLALAVLAGLAAGAKPLSPAAVLSALMGQGSDEALIIVRELRLPRVLLGLAVGAALAVAGAIIQSATRNPLGDPGLLGINAGASLAVVVGAGVLGLTGTGALLALAAMGAGLAALAVGTVAGGLKGGVPPVQLTLAGVAVGALCFGLAQGFALSDPERFDLVRNWRVGALAGDARVILPAVLPAIGAGLALAALLAPRLNVLTLGADRAAALGLSVARTQVLSLLAVILLAGGATAAAGPIAFVGLAAPHMARRLTLADERQVLANAAVLGAALLIAADALGRSLAAPSEVPAGVVTALIGAPVLIALARLRWRRVAL
ncbi:iron-enterobactin transporter membrane protein [Azorhizobium oxalatiphilum]|uniref:Iron-enterobactin transporter membrane protein n=1 Tax=Azorhizobium oxalatiphilum TaxID=980631 RepID=A0A917BTN3_9HYPH|nr:iron chelate uptake ABC transporter family permease subunit [Azorhizobium oxalatiphilum]GGF54048.1 iron-enterobactin transporter membrane protein [Azorhizobium oxalatiphilum]